MKIIAPPSASSWDVRSWRSRPRLYYVVANYSALLRNVSAFETSHVIYNIIKLQSIIEFIGHSSATLPVSNSNLRCDAARPFQGISSTHRWMTLFYSDVEHVFLNLTGHVVVARISNEKLEMNKANCRVSGQYYFQSGTWDWLSLYLTSLTSHLVPQTGVQVVRCPFYHLMYPWK